MKCTQLCDQGRNCTCDNNNIKSQLDVVAIFAIATVAILILVSIIWRYQ